MKVQSDALDVQLTLNQHIREHGTKLVKLFFPIQVGIM